jgi:hypothetical protein
MVEPCVAGYPPLFYGFVNSYIYYNKNKHFYFEKNVKIMKNFQKFSKYLCLKMQKYLKSDNNAC